MMQLYAPTLAFTGHIGPDMEGHQHDQWMHRCLQLAALGAGRVAPNPMVGAVLVHDDSVLAEGWHRSFGGPHAEVECLRAFGDGSIPSGAVLYVNLEPCAHHGKTPPCADLIVQRGIKRVVVGQRDPFPSVSGKGIAILQNAGIDVTMDVEADACRWAQRRFLTSVEHGRPYVVLKWAQSRDGFLDQHPREERGVQRISGPATDVLVHSWRSAEQAILVGSRTVVNDDPSLSVRHVDGLQPLRVVLDRNGITPAFSKVYDGSAPTLLLTGTQRPNVDVEQVITDPTTDPLEQLLGTLHSRNIRSVLVEGGAELLGHFIRSGKWDEARVITGVHQFLLGTTAPALAGPSFRSITSGDDHIEHHVNPMSPSMTDIIPQPTWDW